MRRCLLGGISVAILLVTVVRAAVAGDIAKEIDSETEFKSPPVQPLHEAVDFLSDLHNISIRLDDASLQTAGVSRETPLDYRLTNLSLRSALNLMLGQEGLACRVEKERIVVYAPLDGTVPRLKSSKPQEQRDRAFTERCRVKVSYEFAGQPLRNALDALSESARVPVFIDERGCRGADLELDGEVTAMQKDVLLKEALENILRGHGLKAVLRDEVVFITPAE